MVANFVQPCIVNLQRDPPVTRFCAGLNRGGIGAFVVLIFLNIRNLRIRAVAGQFTAIKGNVIGLPCHRLILLILQDQQNVGWRLGAGFQRLGIDGQRRRFFVDRICQRWRWREGDIAGNFVQRFTVNNRHYSPLADLRTRPEISGIISGMVWIFLYILYRRLTTGAGQTSATKIYMLLNTGNRFILRVSQIQSQGCLLLMIFINFQLRRINAEFGIGITHHIC